MALTTTLLFLLALQQPITVGGGCDHSQHSGSPGPTEGSDTVGGQCNHAFHGGAPGPGSAPNMAYPTPFFPGPRQFVSGDAMELDSGWIVDVKSPVPGEPIVVRWFANRDDWNAKTSTREEPLLLPEAAMKDVRFAGPLDWADRPCGARRGYRLVVGGVDAYGVGKLVVMQIKAGTVEPPVYKWTRILLGDYAGEVPVAIAPLYGKRNHALVLTEPSGYLLDVDLALKPDDEPRLLGKFTDEALGDNTPWPGKSVLTTAVHASLGTEYKFEEAVGPLSSFTSPQTRTFVIAPNAGNGTPTRADFLWGSSGSSADLPAAKRLNLTEQTQQQLYLDGGLRKALRPKGQEQQSDSIVNRDLLQTRLGRFAEVEVHPEVSNRIGQHAVNLHWKREGGPWRVGKKLADGTNETHDTQTFHVPGRVLAAGVVGPGQLLVSVHDEAGRANRLELYSVTAPEVCLESHPNMCLWPPVDPKNAKRHIHETTPKHLRTVHATPDFAGEGVVAILQNHGRLMSAFVQVKNSSALCEVDLFQTLGPAVPVLSAEQQPFLSRNRKHVDTSLWGDQGATYRMGNLNTGDTDCWSSLFNELYLFDRNRDGALDGIGGGSGAFSEWTGELPENTGTNVFAGMPLE